MGVTHFNVNMHMYSVNYVYLFNLLFKFTIIISKFAVIIFLIIKKILGLTLVIIFKIFEIIGILCEIFKEIIILIHTLLYSNDHMLKFSKDIDFQFESNQYSLLKNE